MTARIVLALVVTLALAACGDAADDNAADPAPSASPTRTSAAPSAAPSTAPSDDTALLDDLVAFAVSPNAETVSALPFAAQVHLGLGPAVVATQPREALRSRAAWNVDLEAFRGYVGPFNALELIADHVGTSGSLDRFEISNGNHPHCAGPPVPPPAELADQRRLSLQPAEELIDGCLEWFTVDLFLDEENTITGVTLDLWEP